MEHVYGTEIELYKNHIKEFASFNPLFSTINLLNISITNPDGTLKTTGQVLKELSHEWNKGIL